MNALDAITSKFFGGESKKLESASDQSLDELKLVEHIKTKIEEVRTSGARTTQEGIWMTNSAYLMGYDGIFYDASLRQYRPIGNGLNGFRRSRIRVNKILPYVQNRTARLCKSPPKYDVRPNSNDQADKDAARLGTQLLEFIWDRERINEKRISLMMLLQQCGYSFFHVGWDSEKGEPLVNPMTGESEGYEGDIVVDVVSSFEVFSDPLARSLNESAWVIRAKVRKLDYFREHYPDRGYLVKEEGAWLLSLVNEMRLNSITTASQGSNTERQMKNAAIEMVYYERRSKKHPNGRMVTIANGVLLEDKELPCGEIPLVKFDDIVIGGKFAAEACITHARPIQDQLNRLIAKRAQWTNKMLAGKVLAAKGHGIMAQAFNNESGEIIEYTPVPNASPPQALDIPNIPQYAYNEEDKLDGMMDQIFGINEISRGVLPAAGIPAVGMQFLQEQDETRIGIEVEQHEHAYAQLGSLILKYIAKYYTMPRKLKIAGEGMDYIVKRFTGRDLRDNFDVIVVRGSTIPGSKTIKRQEIINAYTQGLLGDPADPKVRQKVLSMLEYGFVSEMWQDQSLDMAQIKKYLEMIEQEEVPPLEELDNHELIIQELNRYRKTDKFENLSDASQIIFREFLEYHVQALIGLTNPQIHQDVEMANEMSQQGEAVDPEQAVAENPQPDMAAMMDLDVPEQEIA